MATSPEEQIRSARDEMKITTGELADLLGMGKRGYTLINKWERGAVRPNTSALTAVKLLQRIYRLEQVLMTSMKHIDLEEFPDLIWLHADRGEE